MVAGPLRPAARADQEVDRLLLAHDDVLETVLERLGAALAAGRGNGVLEGVDALRLDLGRRSRPVDDRLDVGAGRQGAERAPRVAVQA